MRRTRKTGEPPTIARIAGNVALAPSERASVAHRVGTGRVDVVAAPTWADALRGLGIAAGSLLPDNQVGATIKGGLNAVNTAGNVTRDFLIRRTNDERPRKRKKKKQRS